jgi:hypothetical protein
VDSKPLIVARNFAIIAVIALGLAVLPGGDAAADAVLAALTLTLAIAIGVSLHALYARSGLTLASISDRQRAALFGAVAAIVLMFAAADEMLDTGLGALAWIAVLLAAGLTIYSVWREAHTY